MPIYEYRCEACDHEMEALQKLNDPVLTECTACHQAALKKKMSVAGFRLSGKGWYETDFKKGKKKNLAGDAEEKPVNKKPADNKAKTTTSSTADKGSTQSAATSATPATSSS